MTLLWTNSLETILILFRNTFTANTNATWHLVCIRWETSILVDHVCPFLDEFEAFVDMNTTSWSFAAWNDALCGTQHVTGIVYCFWFPSEECSLRDWWQGHICEYLIFKMRSVTQWFSWIVSVLPSGLTHITPVVYYLPLFCFYQPGWGIIKNVNIYFRALRAIH